MTDRLDAGPLRAWLEHIIEDCGGSERATAAKLGITHAEIGRFRSVDTVSVGAADRLFVKAGDPGALARLYPLDEVLEEAWCDDCAELVGVGEGGECVWCGSRAESPSAVAA